jgi:hypothetical protein
MQQDIRDLIMEKQQETLNNSITTIGNIVKDFQKTIKLVVIVNSIALVVILGTFFISYFTSDSTSEIKERNSNYNYNENINKNN